MESSSAKGVNPYFARSFREAVQKKEGNWGEGEQREGKKENKINSS